MGSVSLLRLLLATLILLSNFGQLLFKVGVLEWKHKLVDIVVHVVCPEVFVCLLFGHNHHFITLNELISNFNWQSEIQIEKACLTHVFELGTSLANFSLLVSKLLTRVAIRFPAKHREWSLANLTLSCKFTLGHAHVRVVS